MRVCIQMAFTYFPQTRTVSTNSFCVLTTVSSSFLDRQSTSTFKRQLCDIFVLSVPSTFKPGSFSQRSIKTLSHPFRASEVDAVDDTVDPDARHARTIHIPNLLRSSQNTNTKIFKTIGRIRFRNPGLIKSSMCATICCWRCSCTMRLE